MRKLVITQNITLDGSIEMLDDWFDPQSQDEDLLAESHRQDAQADALLLGRQTFEDFRGYWPKQTDDATGVTGYLNQVAKYVVSSTMTDPDRQYQPGAHLDRGRVNRRIPIVRLPDGAGPRPSSVSRWDCIRPADVGPTTNVVPIRHHAAALRRLMPELPCGGHRASRGPEEVGSGSR